MTDRYALIGFPLGHSFSPLFFNGMFAREGINAVYEVHELADITDFPGWLVGQVGLKGFNVTVPHKRAVMDYIDVIDPVATAVGAVNCVCVRDGKTLGYNTDVLGFERSLRPLLHNGINNALVLGTGGSSKAVGFVLRQLGIGYQLVSRVGGSSAVSYDEVTVDVLQDFQLIINTTPVGMYPHTDEFPLLPYWGISSQHVLYDLTYNPDKTQFLIKGEAQGAKVVNGRAMLELQALAGWELWNRK